MRQIQIGNDPDVLEHIYRHFGYLKDYPLQLRGSFIDDAESIGVLSAQDFLGFVMAYEVTGQQPIADHFVFLTREENLAIRFYRHVRPVMPWPQPQIGVAFDFVKGEGVVTGTHRVDVVMKDVGNAQMWWGGEVGVIWEAFFDRDFRGRDYHEALMGQLWSRLENYLKAQGVKQVWTHDRDPALEEGWYRAFLTRRGYRLDPERPGRRAAVMKGLR